MRALAAIAAYEIRRSWPVVAVALAGALAARSVPGTTADAMLVVGFTAGVICVARATGDLASPRRAFFFARPLSAAALWWAKVGAGVILLAGCVAVPAALLLWTVGPPGRPLGLVTGAIAAVVLGALAGVLLGGLASGSRAVVATVAGLIALLAWQPRLVAVPIPSAFYWRAPSAEPVTLAISTVVLGVVLLAGALATTRGRTDGRRAAATFVAPLVGCVALLVLVNGWWQWRVEAAPAARFAVVRDAHVLPGGEWVVVTGGVADGLEFETNRLVHLPSGLEYETSAAIAASATGGTIAWLDQSGAPPDAWGRLVKAARLGAAGERDVRDLGPSPAAPVRVMALSPSGTALAIGGGGHVVVVDASTSRQLVRVAAGDIARFPLLHFDGDDRLIVARGPAGATAPVMRLQLLDLNFRSRNVAVLADALDVGPGSALALDVEARRLLAWQQGRAGTPRAHAASTGLHVFEVSRGSATPRWSHVPARTLRVAAFLRDGRVAAVEADDRGGELRVFDGDAGTSPRVVTLPAVRTGEPFVPWRLVELSPSALAIEARAFPAATAATFIVSLPDGAVVRLPDGFAPLPCRTVVQGAVEASIAPCGEGAGRAAYFRVPGPAIVSRDAVTGAMTPVFTMGR